MSDNLSIVVKRRSPIYGALSGWRRNIIYFGFAAVFLAFAVLLRDQGFLNPGNLLNIVRQSAMIAIMAVAMTFVLAAGEIDLSLGATAGCSAVATAIAIKHAGPFAGVFAGLGVGVVVGGLNGLLTTRVGIPSFLTTLGTMGIARGAAMWISSTKAVPILSDPYNYIFGGGNVGPVPILLLWTLVFATIGHVVLRRTTYGRQVLATGGNETAARYSGTNTRSVRFWVLLVSGVAAGVAGMLYAGRLESGRFQFGEGDELSVIAATVLGGTSLFGGVGTVVGSVVGALLIGLINNGLILMGLEYSQQLIARGAIILLAVSLSQQRPR